VQHGVGEYVGLAGDVRTGEAMTQDILDKFKMGYFLLYRNDGSIFGNAIVAKQRQAGFSIDASLFIHVEVSGGEVSAINIAPPQSQLIDITKIHKGRTVRVVRYKDSSYEAGKRYKVAYFSASLCNKGYDFGGILAFLFKWIKQSNRLVFCSEGCAWALQMVFPGTFGGIIPDKVMPAHFTSFETVWEGVVE